MHDRKITATLLSTFLYIIIETLKTVATNNVIHSDFPIKVILVFIIALFLNFFVFPRIL